MRKGANGPPWKELKGITKYKNGIKIVMSIHGNLIWIEGNSNSNTREENGLMDTIPNQKQIVEIPRKQIGNKFWRHQTYLIGGDRVKDKDTLNWVNSIKLLVYRLGFQKTTTF